MSDRIPHLDTPTADDIEAAGSKHYLSLSDDEVALFEELLPHVMGRYGRLEELDDGGSQQQEGYRDRGSEVVVVREPGRQPDLAEDPLNALVRTCEVRSKTNGPLSDFDVGVKDNIAVAGVEMTCGSSLMHGFVPEKDATVVTAILAGGATITAKTNMSAMAYTGSGELTATGDMLNPNDPGYLSGGSSGGSAAAVVEGTVDVALGTDQAGSVRIPAAWCGCVGFKPTHGRVPYTGIVGLGPSFDHVGPLARSVEDCARVLESIAVRDPLDPRQSKNPAGDFLTTLATDLDGTRIGVLEEGFDGGDVSEAVRDALKLVAAEGAATESTSVPLHDDGKTIYDGVANEAVAALFRDEGIGHYQTGYYDEQLARALGRARRTGADDLPVTLKFALVAGQYMADEYFGTYHAKAQNLRHRLTASYDEALSSVDVLALPTTCEPPLAVESDLSDRDALVRSASMLSNTAPFNCSGHPAVSLPCGTVDELPVGLMLVGRRNEDETVLRVARGVESATMDVTE